MTDLRKAAEMALEYFEDAYGLEDTEVAIKEALRQALAHKALDRMVAENERLGLYEDGPAVKTYCGGKPNYCTPVDAVSISQECVDKKAKREHEEKNT